MTSSQKILTRTEIRLALPSKGRLAQNALDLLTSAGLRIHKPNPRQFKATVPNLPGLVVLFQRASDIVVGVRNGSVDFGITGGDVIAEKRGDSNKVLTLLDNLDFGYCSLNVIIPEKLETVYTMADLARYRDSLGRPLRVATKFPQLTSVFLTEHNLEDSRLIFAEGTLEVAPTIGYADLIVDLVSTGTTIRDNRLRKIKDGLIMRSQAWLIANRDALKTRPEVLTIAHSLLEFIVAHLRAAENVLLSANVRGETPEAIAERVFSQTVIRGLQGPTIAPILTRSGERWYDVNIVVRKTQLAHAIAELRAIGGSGVIATPVVYIFEEEPAAYQQMLRALED
ncbi:MAG: ATP phosphoribosyltransferase [Anaerolineales bacterium]